MSNKPANSAILADQKARRAREDAKQQRSSKSSKATPTTASQRTSILPRLVLFALFLPLLSHFLTGTWHFDQAPTVRKYALRAWSHPANPFAPPLREFTTLQLAQYDGSDPSRPIYLSIGGDVFDVSANPRMYGKGGAYNCMAGRDSSRAFITGCFETHQTHDLRGLSENEVKGLETWKNFFLNSDKYFKVGTALLPPIVEGSPIPPPCNPQAVGEQAPAHHRQGGAGAGKPKTGGEHKHKPKHTHSK